MRLPYIHKHGETYQLRFEIPEGTDLSLEQKFHESLSASAKRIYESHGVTQRGFPRLLWSDSNELENIALWENAGGVFRDTDRRGYNLKNIDFPQLALAGLQILAEYFKILEISKRS